MGTVEGILGCVGGNVGVTVLPRSVVEASQSRCALRVEAFMPEPLIVETLFVRRSGTPVGTTVSAFERRLCASEAVASRLDL